MLRLLEGYARLRQHHLVVLLLDRVVQLDRVLLLDLLFLLLNLVHDVRPVFGQAPDEVVVAREIEAEVQLQVLLQADVEGRSHPARPQLEVRDLLPTQALPRCHVRSSQVRVEDDQIDDEELEQNIDRKANPSKCFGIINSLGELEGQKHEHEQLDLLQPEVDVEVFPVPLANAVAEPWAMVVVCRDALLTHPAVLGS